MSAPALELNAAPAESTAVVHTGSPRVDLWVLWLAFGSSVVLTFSLTVDDPFTTLRYAHNILSGHGPVFNVGQRVNGATSPTGLVLAIIAVASPGGFTMLKLKLLSLLFGGLTVGWSKRLVDQLDLPVLLRRMALFLIGANPIIGFASGSGLETTLEAFALVGLVVELRSGRAFVRSWPAAVFAAVATASRPEGVLLLAALLLVAIFVETPIRFWMRVRWAVPSVVTLVAISAADRVYYGSVLPNTYYAKHVPISQALSGGFGYLEHGWELGYSSSVFSSFDRILLWASLSGVAGCLLTSGLIFAAARFSQLGYVGAVCIAQLVFILGSGGDWMQGSRFLAPIVPFLLILTVSSIAATRRVQESRVPIPPILICLLTVTTLFPYAIAVSGASGPVWELRGLSDHQLVANGGYSSLSKLWVDSPQLLTCVPKGGVVALTEVGYTGVARLDLRVLDLRGLVSREVAMSASPASRHYYGVQDLNWASPDSPIGKIISRTEPDAILTIDTSINDPLDGKYRLLRVDSTSGATLALYARVGGPCDRPPPT